MNVKNIKSFIEFYRFLDITNCISIKPRNSKNSMNDNDPKNELNQTGIKTSTSKMEKLDFLETIRNEALNLDCDLKDIATNLVFSDGNCNSNIMLLGEAPGAREDIEGKPFVGEAGQLLDKMLASINLDRKNVYITNVVNYRPPQNRKPTDKEILKYLPFLKIHIEIINPKILILLGSTALNSIVGNQEVISKARGKWNKLKIGKSSPFVIASFHPAFLMRQPDQKKMAWTDLKLIRRKIIELGIKIEK